MHYFRTGYNQRAGFCFIICAALAVFAGTAKAGPYGFDLHNALKPASGGMAGTSLTKPQDVPSSVFGNPATLTQFNGTQFSFGATFYSPEVDLTHDGTVTGTPFTASTDTKKYPVPSGAVTQDLGGLGIPATVGLGFTVVSGIGADFRQEPASLGTHAEVLVFGVNAGLGYELTERLSLGAMSTITFGTADIGLSSTGGKQHDISARGTLGINYDVSEDTSVGVFWQSPLVHNFRNLFQVGTDGATGGPIFRDQQIEQPMNIGVGIANETLMDGNLLLAADYMHKFWDQTDFWGDIYDDQNVFSVGAQLSQGNWRYRLGYGYADDPTKSNPTRITGLSQVQAGPGGAIIPLNSVTIPYLQATEAEVIYQHRITGGLGYKNLIMPGLDADMHVGWQLENDRNFGGHTTAEVYSWHVGFGLTWRF